MRRALFTLTFSITLIAILILSVIGLTPSNAQSVLTVTAVDTPYPLVVSSDGLPYVCSAPKSTQQPLPLLIMPGGEWLACIPVRDSISTPTRIPTQILVTRPPTITPTATVPTCATIATGTTTLALNVRAGPGTSFAVTRILKQGDVVFIVERRNGWARLCSTKEEWASETYLKIVVK